MAKPTKALAVKKAVPSKKPTVAAKAKKAPSCPGFPKGGRLVRLVNVNRTFGSARDYLTTLLVDERGNEGYAMFTDIEIKKALARAKRNPEDFIQATRRRKK